MEAFFVSLGTVAIAEMGDRTQLLSLMLVARYGQPWSIIAGILIATFANHVVAGLVGAEFGQFLSPARLNLVVGLGMIGMALWALIPDRLARDDAPRRRGGVFVATVLAFFVAEIGDKTQIATVALAAAYPSVAAVVAGTTCGMLVANLPVVLLGNAFAAALPLRTIHIGAALLFVGLGLIFLMRSFAAPGN